MIMNMLTGAHAALIPLITALHAEAAVTDHHDISGITEKLNAVFSYEAESWVKDMTVDMVIDFFEKLPEDVIYEVSQRMDLHDGLPLRFCLYLMDKNSKIAEKLIESSEVLDTTDLLYRIQSGKVHEMIAVARRKNLTPEVLNALVESCEPEVYMELLNNPCVQVQADVIRHLADVAHRSPKMAWYMVASKPHEERLQA